MKIVIIGLGSIGRTVLSCLAAEGHSITAIDENSEKIDALIEKYDVLGIVGNGACMDVQEEASVREADVVIVLTRSDELNILACLVAKKLGAANTIARVRNPQYRKQILQMKDDLGISMIINPEKETADEIYNLINLPSITQVERFAKGRVLLVEIVMREGCPLIGLSLHAIGKTLHSKVLICAVLRDGQVFIPTGSFSILEGDKIYITADANSLSNFLLEIELMRSPLKTVMIVGGGRTSFYLADKLSKKKYRVKMIVDNKPDTEDFAERLPDVMVLNGNGTQHDLLIEEGIESMDAFVALTNIDEENMIVAMFANKEGVQKTIAQIKSEDLYSMLNELGLYCNVSPKDIVAGKVTSYVRALGNKKGSNVLTLYRLVANQVEALEFSTQRPERYHDIPLRDLNIKRDCLVACIIRSGDVIFPNGDSCITLGDNVIVVTTHKSFNDLSDIFE